VIHSRQLFALFAAALFSTVAFAAPKPNVLFIAVDDLVPTLGCYGDAVAKTPQMDSLGAQGDGFSQSSLRMAGVRAFAGGAGDFADAGGTERSRV
jgi:hypothetical protein